MVNKDEYNCLGHLSHIAKLLLWLLCFKTNAVGLEIQYQQFSSP